MPIYCTETICEHFKILEKPVKFNFDKQNYKAFDFDEYPGICANCAACFNSIDKTINNTHTHEVQCLQYATKSNTRNTSISCFATECSWNNNLKCQKENIFISKGLITNDVICKSLSFKGITGHWDWTRLLNPDGTAKGGNIDDDYAKKLDKKARNYSIYPDGHHRESNPRPIKRK